jgi:hypothetical protein
MDSTKQIADFIGPWQDNMVAVMEPGGQQKRLEQRSADHNAAFMQKTGRPRLVMMLTFFSQQIEFSGIDLVMLLILGEYRISSGDQLNAEDIRGFAGKKDILAPSAGNRAVNLQRVIVNIVEKEAGFSLVNIFLYNSMVENHMS